MLAKGVSESRSAFTQTVEGAAAKTIALRHRERGLVAKEITAHMPAEMNFGSVRQQNCARLGTVKVGTLFDMLGVRDSGFGVQAIERGGRHVH